jgi:hypothetical protein
MKDATFSGDVTALAEEFAGQISGTASRLADEA